MLLFLSQKRNSLPIKAYVQKKLFPGSNSKTVATAFPQFCRAQVLILHMKSAEIKVNGYFVDTKCHCDILKKSTFSEMTEIIACVFSTSR